MHCRPLELEYTKETTKLAKQKAKELDHITKDIEVSIINDEGRLLEVKHTILPTMYDGKIASAATDSAAQNFNVSKATPKMMNDRYIAEEILRYFSIQVWLSSASRQHSFFRVF